MVKDTYAFYGKKIKKDMVGFTCSSPQKHCPEILLALSILPTSQVPISQACILYNTASSSQKVNLFITTDITGSNGYKKINFV